MFGLVALLCLYMGTGNLFKAFALPFSQWAVINWSLFVTAVLLLITALFCTKQAMKDFAKAKSDALEKKAEEEKAKKALYHFDDELEAEKKMKMGQYSLDAKEDMADGSGDGEYNS
ncbi:MAG: hypothetical protein RR253_05525 [Oscillospiraceae bacterium]